MKYISIKGARENNLKQLDIELPRDQFIVVTGVSGSGKSSLAFDTLFAEGQRRYVESLSLYMRQLLQQHGRPDVDFIDGLSPAISIQQQSWSRNPRSTVGTSTEILDYLRLLFARLGRAYCHLCGQPIEWWSSQQIVDHVCAFADGTRLLVLAPVESDSGVGLAKRLDELRRDGFSRFLVDGKEAELPMAGLSRSGASGAQIDVCVDRLVLKSSIRSRLADSVELALRIGAGEMAIAVVNGKRTRFADHPRCFSCGTLLPERSPKAFSFNSPEGACARCGGLGLLLDFDESRIVADQSLSLKAGAITPWSQRSAKYYQQVLEALAVQFKFDLYQPYRELSPSVKHLLMHGSGEIEVDFEIQRGSSRQRFKRPFEGVLGVLRNRLAEQNKRGKNADSKGGHLDDVPEELSEYMIEQICPDCGGSRLRPEARAYRLVGTTIDQVVQLSVDEARSFFKGLKPQLSPVERKIGRQIFVEIENRLSFLASVGLGYLTLARGMATLSGGESQRVRLATQIGASLVGVLYILDEPSAGLHPRDNALLLDTLCRLRDQGNTVIVVEHDEATIRAADWLIDIGPGAGPHGGNLVASGTASQVMSVPESLTGQYLSGARRIEVPLHRRRCRNHLRLLGVRHNNLKNVDLHLPLGVLTCITGVSGSGKSSLIVDTLLPALQNRLYGSAETGGIFSELRGTGGLKRVVAVSQRPIGRSPRSNPATFCGIFTPLRELFASLPESKARGYKAGRYSFNVKGGRCEACQGDGSIRIEMHFLPDVYVKCSVCHGTRFNRETLEVRYRGYSIADFLQMSVEEATRILSAIPALKTKLDTLCAVGLGYLTLGQAANTLSGGEAQRIKLSRELSRRQDSKTLYILDEPTTGLHWADIHRLLGVLERLVEAGHSVVIIEHHLDVVKCADFVIDLGPDGGESGGEICAAGTPEEISVSENSITGGYLRSVLGNP